MIDIIDPCFPLNLVTVTSVDLPTINDIDLEADGQEFVVQFDEFVANGV